MPFKIFLCYLALASLVSFVLYAVDKSKAKRRAWRISEKALLLSGVFGGAIGALLAMQLLRHKTKHFYFYLVNVMGLVIHVGVALLLLLAL